MLCTSTIDGTSHSNPIEILREDRSLAEQIAFSGSNVLHGTETQVSEFVQDHWVPTIASPSTQDFA